MGLEPGEGHRHVLGRERRTLDVRPVTWVIEERSVDAFEQAIVDHGLLARATLFGRCAQEDDLAGKRIPDRGQPDRRADPRCSHRVVTAAVAKPRQRVIFGKHRDPRPLRSAAARKASPDRRREAADRVLDVIAMAPDRGGDPGRSLDLLDRRLRIGVDPVRQLQDLTAVRLDRVGDPLLDLAVRAGGTRGRQRQRQNGSSVRIWPRRAQRSTDRVASATKTIARMNRATWGWNRFWRRRTTRTATTTVTHAPRLTARIQSPR